MNWHDPRLFHGAWLMGGTLLLSLLLWAVGRQTRTPAPVLTPGTPGVLPPRERLGRDLLRAISPPLQFAAWYYCLYFVAPLLLHAVDAGAADWLERNRFWLWHLGLVVAVFGCLFRAVAVLDDLLSSRLRLTPSQFDDFALRLGVFALRTLIPLFALVALIHFLPLPGAVLGRIDPFLTGAFIVCAAIIAYRGILDGEKTILSGLDLKGADSYAARGIQTRARILRKFAVVFNGLIAASALLMLIPAVRTLGASLLASAGIVGIVLGFAAQKTLGTLFAGLQIALTQPIRIGDQVIVQGDSCTVEAINLTYVVLLTWDGRRQIIPISYFIEQPFQNWTLLPTPMIATVKIRVDFTLPLAPIRDEMKRWIEANPVWNRKSYAFQVTDADGSTMELRVIAGVANSGASFGMQCDLREKMISYLQEHYPLSLPRSRQESVTLDPPGKMETP